jgi:hypothetical protein
MRDGLFCRSQANILLLLTDPSSGALVGEFEFKFKLQGAHLPVQGAKKVRCGLVQIVGKIGLLAIGVIAAVFGHGPTRAKVPSLITKFLGLTLS